MSKDILELEQTLASDPHNRDAFEALEEQYVKGKRWQDMVRLYENQSVLQKEMPKFWDNAVSKLEALSADLEELPERAEVLIQIGRVWEYKLERSDQAMVHYQRAFKVWPYKTEALAMARNIYVVQKNWKLVLRLFDLELQVEKVPEKQAAIHFEKGRISAEYLDDAAGAVGMVRKAAELDPNNDDIKALLASLTDEKPDWMGELQNLRNALSSSGKGAGAAALHVSIAKLLLVNDSSSEDIELELEAALEIVPHHSEARKLLAGVYRLQDRWEDLAEMLQKIAGEATVRKEDAREALIELASVQRTRFDNEEAAVATFEKLLALDPAHPDALRFAEDFYERNENWDALVDLYENALRIKRSSPDELELRLQLGEMLWKKVGDLSAAERHFRRVRLANPKRPEMLRFYQHFFKEQSNWKKYYSTLASLRQVVATDEERLEVAYEMARVAREEMKSPEKAIDVWKQVLKVDKTNEVARQSLHDLYIEAKKWNALLEHYKEEVSLLSKNGGEGSKEKQVELSLKMVEIYRDRLRLDPLVINTYNAILNIDPENEQAIDALAQRYEKSKRWNDLINILQRKADVVGQGDPSKTLPLLHRIAELWQKRLGNISQAIPALEQVLEIDAADKTAITELKKIYNKRHKWEELLVVLEKEAALMEPGKDLASHLSGMARIARQRLSDSDQARDLHERVCTALELEDGEVADAALYRGALGALEQIYADQDNDEALVVVLRRRLKVTQSKGQQIDLLERLAALVYESLGDAESATGLWGQILELQPANQTSLERLKDHYFKEHRWDDLEALFGQRDEYPRLFEVLDTGADMVDEDAERVDLYHRMARIAKESLNDNDKVMLSLESVLGIEPANIEVASQLLPYYREAGEASKEVKANMILLENEGGDAFDLSREIGRLYERELEDLPSAFEWADKAFRMRPEDADLRGHIEGLARSAERLAELVASYRQVAEGVDDESVRLDLYRTVARTANVDLEWFDDAVDYYERILIAVDEDIEAVDALLILYRQLSRWSDLLDVMQSKIGLLREADDNAGAVDMHFQMAELLQGPLERRAEAIDAYRTILDTEPGNLAAVRGLKTLHEAEENWSGVAEAMETELSLLEADESHADAAAQLRLGLGQLFEHKLDEPDRAVDWYASLLESDASEERAPAVSALEGLLGDEGEVEADRRVRIATLLEPVHRKDDNHSRLTEMLEIRIVAISDDDARKSETLWELSRLYEQKNEDIPGAFSALRRLLALTPGDDQVWNELERLGGQIDRWDEIADLYEGLTPGHDELDVDAWRFEMLRRQARVYEQELSQDGRARESYEILLARDDADQLTIDSLDKVYGRLGANVELVELLGRKATLVEDAAERRGVFFRIAALHETDLAQPSEAIDTYRQVLVEHPSDPETLDHLERLFKEQSRWEDLVELLQRRVDLAEDEPARHDVKFQLGGVYQERLEDLSGAIDVYREIVQANPEHVAIDALEGLSADLFEQEGDLTLRRTIDDTLEPIYDAGEAWEKLVHVLGLKLGYAETDDERVGLRVRIARLYRDKLEDASLAFDHLKVAVSLRFGDNNLREEFEALASQTGSHYDVIGLYESALDGDTAAADPDLRRAVLQRIATLYEEELKDVASAIDAYRRMLDLDPEDKGALASLERLHEQEGQWADLVEICLSQANMVDDTARVDVLRKVGELYRGPLDDAPSAVDTYKRILDLVPGDAGALDALENLYSDQGAWRDLIYVLHEKISAAEAVESKRGFYFRIAALHEDELQESHEAIEIFNKVLELLPEDSQALDDLDRLFESHERWQELSSILERKLALQDEAAAQNELQFRLGQVQQDRLYNVEEAIATYKAILDRDASYEDARQALVALLEDHSHRFASSKVLEPLYRTEALHQDLVALLELQLEDTDEDGGRLGLLDDIAGLQEKDLEDKASAFHAVRRAYLIDPTARGRIESMERLAEETGSWASLVQEAYEPALPEINEGDELLRVHLKIARVYRDELGDAASAEASFRNALGQEPECLEAMEDIEALLESQDRWEDLLDILGEKLAVLTQAGDNAPALAVLFKKAHIHDSILSSPIDAIETYRSVLDMDEANAEAIHNLKALYRREERWEDLTSLLIQEIGFAADVATTVALRSELAQVYHAEMDDVRQAVEVYHRILEDAPDNPETITALEGFFQSDIEAQLVASILEPIYRRRESWGPLVQVLEVHLKEQYEGPERESSLIQIARLNEERLGDVETSLSAYERLLEENPTISGVWDQIERLASALEAWERVAEAYGRTLVDNLRVTDEVRLPLLLRQAHVLDERLDRIEEAMVVYREVLLYDDTNALALDALDRIYTRMESWADLVELYRRAAEMSDDEARRLKLYYKIATLHEEILQDADDAIDAYRRILDSDPDERDAVRGLERLYQQQQMWRELSELYRREATGAEDEETATGLKHQLATVLCGELDEVAEAIGIFRDILETRPTYAPTRRALEGLLREVSDDDLRLQMAVMLQPLYNEASEWEKLIHVYEVQLNVIQDPADRVAILREVARLKEAHQGDPHQAFEAYARAFGEDVSDEALQGHLERLAADIGNWGKLIEIYLGAMGVSDDMNRVVKMLHRAAELYTEKLGDSDSAITVFNQILDVDDENRVAIARLEELYGKRGQYQELVDILNRRADLEDEVLEKKETWYRVAELWEQNLRDDEQAIYTYRLIMDIDEEDLAAIEALERLFRRTESWDQLITIFQVKVDVVEETGEKVEVYKQMAEVYEHSMLEVDEAIVTYLTIRDTDEGNLDAIRSLNRLYAAEQRWNDLLDILDTERTLTTGDTDSLNAIEFRMGQLLEEELDQPERAIDMYRQIVERSPEHSPAIEALEELINEPRCRLEAARVLEPLYERKGEWRKLVDAVELNLQETDEPEERRRHLERIAAIHEGKLDSRQMAFITYGRAFREAPENNSPRENLERLAGQMANYEELVAIYEENLEEIYDYDLVTKLSLRLGEIYSIELGDDRQAVDHYRKILDIEEYHPEALDALDELYRKLEDWQELIGVLERKVQIAEGPEKTDLKYRLAYRLDILFEDYDQSINYYKEILTEAPEHKGALEALERLSNNELYRLDISEILEPLYTQRGDWASLVSILGLKLAMTDYPSERCALLRQIAEITEQRLEDPETAFDHYCEAIMADPEDGLIGAQLERLAAECDKWAALTETYELVASDMTDDLERRELLLKVARWHSEKLAQPNEAEARYKEVLDLEPSNSEALDALEAIYHGQSRFTSLYEIYARKADILFDASDRKAMFVKMAGIATEQLAEPDKAIDAWTRLREVDDTDTDALVALEGLYRDAGQWHELIEVLERRADLSDDIGERVSMRLAIGEVSRDQMGEPDLAIDAYRTVLDLDAGNFAALGALEDLFRDTEDWPSLLEVLGQHLTFTETDEERIGLHLVLARLNEDQFEDIDGALDHFRQVTLIDDSHAGAIGELERLYAKAERWFDLQETYLQRLEMTEDPAERIRLHVAISDVSADRLGDVDTAKEHLQKVLDAEPDNMGALDVLGKLFQNDGEWDKAMEVLERQISQSTDASVLSGLQLRRGVVLEENLDSPELALAAYERALELDQSNAGALNALKRVYRDAENWQALINLFRVEGAQLTEASDKIALYTEMAEVAREHLDDSATAVEALEIAYEASDGALEVAEKLLQAYVDASRWDKAEPILEGIIETLSAKRKFKQLYKFHHLRGQIAEKKGDTLQALESFKAAHDIDATYVPNLLSLGKLYVTLEDWDDALKIFQTLLLHQMKIKSTTDKRDVYYNLGRVRLVKGDTRRAKDMFNRALGIDKGHAPSMAALEELK